MTATDDHTPDASFPNSTSTSVVSVISSSCGVRTPAREGKSTTLARASVGTSTVHSGGIESDCFCLRCAHRVCQSCEDMVVGEQGSATHALRDSDVPSMPVPSSVTSSNELLGPRLDIVQKIICVYSQRGRRLDCVGSLVVTA